MLACGFPGWMGIEGAQGRPDSAPRFCGHVGMQGIFVSASIQAERPFNLGKQHGVRGWRFPGIGYSRNDMPVTWLA
jgi:hypothetical protein